MLWDLFTHSFNKYYSDLIAWHDLGLWGYVVDKIGTVSVLHSPEALLRIQIAMTDPYLSLPSLVSA